MNLVGLVERCRALQLDIKQRVDKYNDFAKRHEAEYGFVLAERGAKWFMRNDLADMADNVLIRNGWTRKIQLEKVPLVTYREILGIKKNHIRFERETLLKALRCKQAYKDLWEVANSNYARIRKDNLIRKWSPIKLFKVLFIDNRSHSFVQPLRQGRLIAGSIALFTVACDVFLLFRNTSDSQVYRFLDVLYKRQLQFLASDSVSGLLAFNKGGSIAHLIGISVSAKAIQENRESKRYLSSGQIHRPSYHRL